MKLCIVIPALDEEDSIEKIIVRSLEARDEIIKNTDVDAVEVTVVSDGSTDRTVEIATQYKDQINLIVFEKNKGYGAAIKQGWLESEAELLSFLDADGTCDPKFFVELCNQITRSNSDVALGCRLNQDSKMPLTRRFGNTMFSILLTYLSSEKVRDTASGMRVVRRTILPELMPLPDGLHFTPAMSARALLSNQIKISEKDMPYEERDGESKLHIWKDGIRFLSVIIKTAILYRPNRLLSVAGFVCFIVALLLMIVPVMNYAKVQMLEDWMIYRFTVSNTIAQLSALFFSAAYLSETIVAMSFSTLPNKPINGSLVYKIYNSSVIWVLVALCLVAGVSLVAQSFFQRIIEGQTTEHWSRYISMTFLVTFAFILSVTKILAQILRLIAERMSYLKSSQYSSFK